MADATPTLSPAVPSLLPIPVVGITTTHGVIDERRLARTVGFEDRPTEFVVWVEWRLEAELVRRDAHVILKTPTAIADAVTGGF
jgi:hypothetical protein